MKHYISFNLLVRDFYCSFFKRFNFILALALVPYNVSSFSLLGNFGSNSGHIVKLKSTGPVMLDTPIWFSAELYPYKNGTFTYEWEDNSYYPKTFVDKNQGPISQWNITYSHVETKQGSVTVKVKVYRHKRLLWPDWPIAQNETTFLISNHINGQISIIQPNVTFSNPGFISTLNVTNITTDIHDPFGWLRNHTNRITFYWQMNNKNTRNNTIVGPCFTPSIIINITTPGDYFIESNVIMDLSDQPVTTTTSTTTTTTTTTTTSPSNSTTTTESPHNKTTTTPRPPPPPPEPVGYKCDGWWNGYEHKYSLEEPFYQTFTKYGFFFSEVEAAEPIHNFNVSGSTWVRHGAMLKLRVKCSGTGPFFYCKNITFGSFNESDPKICNDAPFGTNTCEFAVVHYPSQTGTYTLVIRIYNDVSERLERFALNVYNVDRKPQLLHIIIPVTCSLVAIIIIIYGVANFIQNKNRYSVEVADFDFCASEETEYKTFFQQLRESVANAFSADIDTSNREYRHRKSQTERPLILEDED